jgi:prophage DNA circulation protein
MRKNTTRTVLAALAVTFVTLGACSGAPGIPGRGGGSVDPNKCGNIADVSDAGRKLQAMLEATATLESTVKGIEVEVRTGCDAMAKELGIKPEGDNKAVCDAVFAQLKEDLSAGIKADAQLTIEYKPAVCEVSIEAAASAAAQCEASASGSAEVKCSGECTGTCSGACDGTCEGGGGGGECNGKCDGVCQGSCSGGCTGSADVEASAECEAKAEVTASAEMKCTPAELKVEADASVVVDKPRADRAIAAMKAGLPQILTVSAKVKPLKGAVEAWVAAAKGTVEAGKDLAGQFKDQALCLTAQISAMGQAIAGIEASFSFSVEVSVEASASASGSAG